MCPEGREELSAARDLSQFRACVQADEVQERLHDIAAAISAEGEGDYPQAMDCKDRNVQSLLHSTAAEVIRAEERGSCGNIQVSSVDLVWPGVQGEKPCWRCLDG